MSYKKPTVEEYLLDKSKRTYEKVPVGRFKNILLAVDKGTDPEIPQDELRNLVKAGRQSVNIFRRIRTMSARRSDLYGELREGATSYRGFGGFDIPGSRSKIRIKREDKMDWNGPALKERLGETASAIVSEKLKMTFAIPLGHAIPGGEILTSEKAIAVFYSGILATLGFSEENEATTLSTEVEYEVKEDLLAQMVERGQVGPLEGTGTITRTFTPEITAP